MNSKKIRTIVAACVFVVLSIGLIAGVQMGTLSGFGYEAISALCPLGAFTTMIATKTFVPRALVSIVIMGILVFVVGRAFCGWICPIPLLNRIRNFFRSPKKRKALEAAKNDEVLAVARQEIGGTKASGGASTAVRDSADVSENASAAAPLSAEEQASLSSCASDCGSCGICKQHHGKLDSRHAVLGGALLSTAIFGFPVFCLVCPVGLTFATILMVWRLFAAGDMTWSVILVPALLVIELVFLRKWCTRFCPLSALMNLVSRFSKTLRPTIDDSLCLETAKGTACSRCAMVCDADINLRHPDFGERTLADCTRCRACVEACPAHAISMPFVAKKNDDGTSTVMIDPARSSPPMSS